MKIETLVLGEVQTNCYLVFDEKTKRGFIVDPADDALRISAKIGALEMKPEAILLTHGHFDHILAADRLRQRYGIPIFAHRAEASLLSDTRANLSALWAKPFTLKPDRLLENRETFSAAGFDILVLHTPGHTKGSVCYYLEKEAVLLAGDTLFCESYGRTDFAGGSMREMLSSLRDCLFALPDETAVYPGHGPQTQIGYEKRCNPAAERM